MTTCNDTQALATTTTERFLRVTFWRGAQQVIHTLQDKPLSTWPALLLEVKTLTDANIRSLDVPDAPGSSREETRLALLEFAASLIAGRTESAPHLANYQCEMLKGLRCAIHGVHREDLLAALDDVTAELEANPPQAEPAEPEPTRESIRFFLIEFGRALIDGRAECGDEQIAIFFRHEFFRGFLELFRQCRRADLLAEFEAIVAKFEQDLSTEGV